MSLTVELTGEVGAWVEREAAARGVTPAEVVESTLAAAAQPRYPLSFAGIGSSGDGDLATRFREDRAEVSARTGAADA